MTRGRVWSTVKIKRHSPIAWPLYSVGAWSGDDHSPHLICPRYVFHPTLQVSNPYSNQPRLNWESPYSYVCGLLFWCRWSGSYCAKYNRLFHETCWSLGDLPRKNNNRQVIVLRWWSLGEAVRAGHTVRWHSVGVWNEGCHNRWRSTYPAATMKKSLYPSGSSYSWQIGQISGEDQAIWCLESAAFKGWAECTQNRLHWPRQGSAREHA